MCCLILKRIAQSKKQRAISIDTVVSIKLHSRNPNTNHRCPGLLKFRDVRNGWMRILIMVRALFGRHRSPGGLQKCLRTIGT
jgi:hypothetical protein